MIWKCQGCDQRHNNGFNNPYQTNIIPSQDEGDLLGDVIVLPSQVDNKVPSVFVHSDTHIIEPDSIDRPNSDVNHAVDKYANLFYESKNEIDNEFY